MNERKVSGHKTDISWQINYFVWSGLVKRDMRNASVKKHDYYLSLKRSYLWLYVNWHYIYDTIRHQFESVRNYSDLVNQILECKGVTWTAHIHIILTPSWYVHTLVTTLCVANYVTHYTSVSESSVVTFYTEYIFWDTEKSWDLI